MSFVLDETPGDGTCCICGNSYTYNGMTRHVKKCAVEHLASDNAPEWLHIRLRSFDITLRPARWLHVLANSAASLQQLDTYLREVWFGGGEKPSEFDIARTIFANEPAELKNPKYPVEPMTPALGEVLRRGTELRYAYELEKCRSLVDGKIYGHLPRPRLLEEGVSPTPDIVGLACS
ncbi:MAG: hypothetical protein ACLFVJ_14575 [Persicimonas sp.]